MMLSLIVNDRKSQQLSSKGNGVDDFEMDDRDADPPAKRFRSIMLRSVNSSGNSVGGTLIVCPMSLVDQWVNECRNKILSSARMTVLMYYGSDRRSLNALLHTSDIVVTSYGVLVSELKNIMRIVRGRAANANANTDADAVNIDETSGCGRGNDNAAELLNASEDEWSAAAGLVQGLFSIRWRRVVLDEAHIIKNPSTESAKAAVLLQSESRWALTGTPIQNSVNDVYALVRYLHHEPWSQMQWWKKLIADPYEKADARAVSTLRLLLYEIMLRRAKTDRMASGQRIVELPKKTINIVKLQMDVAEREFYQAVMDRNRAEFQGYLASVMGLRNKYIRLFGMLSRMRQICDHPFLALGRGESLNGEENKALSIAPKPMVSFRQTSTTSASASSSSSSASLLAIASPSAASATGRMSMSGSAADLINASEVDAAAAASTSKSESDKNFLAHLYKRLEETISASSGSTSNSAPRSSVIVSVTTTTLSSSSSSTGDDDNNCAVNCMTRDDAVQLQIQSSSSSGSAYLEEVLSKIREYCCNSNSVIGSDGKTAFCRRISCDDTSC